MEEKRKSFKIQVKRVSLNWIGFVLLFHLDRVHSIWHRIKKMSGKLCCPNHLRKLNINNEFILFISTAKNTKSNRGQTPNFFKSTFSLEIFGKVTQTYHVFTDVKSNFLKLTLKTSSFWLKSFVIRSNVLVVFFPIRFKYLLNSFCQCLPIIPAKRRTKNECHKLCRIVIVFMMSDLRIECNCF